METTNQVRVWGQTALLARLVCNQLKQKPPAMQAAIANAHAIEASRKSRGSLYPARPNRDCAEVNINDTDFAESIISIVMRRPVCCTIEE
jgi:hypothetical protein